MMVFEESDRAIIQELMRSGVKPYEIAQKWDVTESKLKTFCIRKGISIPRNYVGNKFRQGVESGDHISPTVEKIIEMHGSKPVRQIAIELKRTENFVTRMIELHCKDGLISSYRKKYNLITSTADKLGISIGKACQNLKISYGAYCYVCRKLGYHNKKAPNQ